MIPLLFTRTFIKKLLNVFNCLVLNIFKERNTSGSGYREMGLCKNCPLLLI